MTGVELERELRIAEQAVREAALLCRAVQTRGPEALIKPDCSPVTVADFAAQALICDRLRQHSTVGSVVAEEDLTELRRQSRTTLRSEVVELIAALRSEVDEGTVLRWIAEGNDGAASERFWTLDPIDGTKGFLAGRQYSIVLALIVAGEVQVAALGCPELAIHRNGTDERGVLITAIRGAGARAAPLFSGGPSRPIRVDSVAEPSAARYCESFESGHSSQPHAARVLRTLGVHQDPVRIDGQVKYGMVARGDVSIFIRIPVSSGAPEGIWDHAAGALIVSEAGGVVTDLNGDSLKFSVDAELSGQGIVATNGWLHDAVLAAVAATSEQS